MYKYANALRIELLQVRTYFFEWLASVAYYPLYLLVLWIIWTTVFRVSETGSLGSYSPAELVCYYFGLQLLGAAVLGSGQSEQQIWDDVRQGGLDVHLVRPINYPAYMYCRALGKALISLSVGLPIMIVVSALLGTGVTLAGVVVFALLFIPAFTIYFSVFFFLGMLSFHMHRIFGVRDVLWTVVHFLSGSMLPLDLLPRALGTFVSQLPFRYVFYGPISVLVGRISPSASLGMVLNAGLWMVGLLFLIEVLWFRALRRYESPNV